MIKKHIITIAGKLGGGKSSTAKKLAELLNYEHLSTGDFMRSIADKRNVTLGELSKIAEIDSSVDIELDNYNREVGKKDNIVLDSRLGFYFIPESFKVFIELDPLIAANRILEDAKINSNRLKETHNGFNTPEKVAEAINERMQSEQKRYHELYGIEDYTAHKNFDLVIDTSSTPLESVVEKIIEEYKKWLNS